jgi:hypothetical protein
MRLRVFSMVVTSFITDDATVDAFNAPPTFTVVDMAPHVFPRTDTVLVKYQY